MRKISIVVPVYNAETTLKSCIDSVVNQSYDEWELWLINDGSRDSSGEICDEYCRSDARIQVIHKQNEGVSVARNTGIEKAQGEYILFLDSDDYLEKDALRKVVDATNRFCADVVIFGFYYHFSESNIFKSNTLSKEFVGTNDQFVFDVFREAFGKELLNPPWNKLVKRELLLHENIQFVSEFSICEDMIFTIEILEKSERIIFLETPLYHYIYKQGSNLVNKFHSNYFEALSFYIARAKEYLVKHHADKEKMGLLDTFYINQTIAFLKRIYVASGYSKEKKYSELIRICQHNDFMDSLALYQPKGVKKKVVAWCIKNKHYRLLHFLYVEILCRK